MFAGCFSATVNAHYKERPVVVVNNPHDDDVGDYEDEELPIPTTAGIVLLKYNATSVLV